MPTTQKLLDEKTLEISQRGLNSYPVDSQEDLLRQDGIALLLNAMVERPIIKLPHADICVRLDPRISAQMTYYLAVGDYEQNDLALISEYVKAGDRVMEFGGGIGVTGVMAARVSKMPVTVVEPNPVLQPLIVDTFAQNQVQLQLIECCAVEDDFAADQVDFHLAPGYWWSSLVPMEDGHKISVPAARFSDLVNEHAPTVLIIDIEGAEKSILPARIAPSVRLILIEIHTPSIGTKATADINAKLTSQGFALRNIGANSWLFER